MVPIGHHRYLSEFTRRWPLKFSLEHGLRPCSSHAAAQNGGDLPSRPAFPSSPGTVLIVGGWQIYFELLYVSAFSCPVKVFKTVFPVSKFMQSLKVYKQFFVDHCESLNWTRLFYHKLSRGWWENSFSALHSNSLKHSNDYRGKLDRNWLYFYLKLYWETHSIMRHCSAEQQKGKQTLTTSKNFNWIYLQ